MSRDWRLFYLDLIDFCRQVLRYTRDLDRPTFEANRLVFDATLRNLELIGEAAKHIPDSVRGQLQEIPWRTLSVRAMSSPMPILAWTAIWSGTRSARKFPPC